MSYQINLTIEDITDFNFNFSKWHKSDINEHISVMHKYANECNHITEFGVRTGVSTWAWLASRAKVIRCFDIENINKDLKAHYESAKDTRKDFTFTCVNTIADKLEIEPTDLLFIDTEHTYEQCSKELKMHAHNVRKYLIFHDTTICQELNKAINEFLEYNKEWKVKEILTNNNGLTVLERIA
jgi:DNA-binding Xre family transcriptional regulator